MACDIPLLCINARHANAKYRLNSYAGIGKPRLSQRINDAAS
jgi:hypothetical protein